MDLIEKLNWRYGTKKMTGETVPAEKIDRILEAIRLSASSAGLQPYKVIVVSDHLLKGRIHEQACQQPQVVEGSHFLVFAAKTSLDEPYIDSYMQTIAEERQIPLESLQPFADSIKGGILTRDAAVNEAWAARQAYIGLGFGLVAAAAEGVDSCAMEGFNPDQMDEILGLKEKGLRSVVVMALGYRDAEKDFLASAKKVRQSRASLFVEMA
jgi:nitroreductase/dihydropteridine reductase